MIPRRKIVLALGATALVSPLSSFAQPAKKVWRIGFLSNSIPSRYILFADAFKAGMSALGYAEGRDYVIELRSSTSIVTH